MRALLHKLDGPDNAFLLQQFVELVEKRGLMFVEQFLSLEVLIVRDHDVVEIAIGDFEVVEAADVALGGDLRPHCDVGDCCQLALLHEAELERMVLAPAQGPAFLLLELQHAATLGVDL